MSRTALRHIALGIALAAASACAAVLLLRLPLVWAWLASISLTAFGAYAYDKRQARSGGWRVPESALHTLAIIGGSPGALLGQRAFRHKTAKTPFQVLFWLIFIAQAALLAWWLMQS